ncbi:MAG TPA: FAD-dependent oxidoreductase [Mycobacterium sp.]|nr:FAD-dependent oxidoreductase [Mycobacterium sp.]HUH70306.1 FAD-dependent oxidoreductase [Mycobacterium sp.]
MTVRNRVVMPPVETMYGTPDGLPSQRTHDYFAARLKGGVGLITLGAPGVDDHHPETPGGLHLATDDAVDAHRALVEVDVVRAAPDAVLVATGGHVAVPAIPGADLPHVHTGPGLREFLGGHAESTDPAWQRLGASLLAGWRQRLVRPATVRLATRAWMPLGRRIAIIGGDLVALELAEFLASRGRLVSILEAGKDIAPEVGDKRKTDTWMASTDWASPCTSGQPLNGSRPRPSCLNPPVGPPGSWSPTASCWPDRSSPTPRRSTPWLPPCPAPTCTPPATAPGWSDP